MAYERITVTPVSGALGAELGNVDLSNLDDATFEEVRQAFLEYQVVFFKRRVIQV